VQPQVLGHAASSSKSVIAIVIESEPDPDGDFGDVIGFFPELVRTLFLDPGVSFFQDYAESRTKNQTRTTT